MSDADKAYIPVKNFEIDQALPVFLVKVLFL